MLKLTKFLLACEIPLNLGSYKIHLATGDKHPPLEAFFSGKFKEWQEWQTRKNFTHEMVISLIELSKNKWLFAGVFRVLGCVKQSEKHIAYETELLPGQDDLIGRIIVEHERVGRAPYLIGKVGGGEFNVSEIREKKMSGEEFPGFNSVCVSFSKLQLGISTMPISRSDIERLFSVGDVIESGGRKSKFRITDIDDDFIRIEPTQSRTKSRLCLSKLAVVVDSFASVDEYRIEASVGALLAAHGLKDTQNESYLYGFAREYLLRKQGPTLAALERELDQAVSAAKQASPLDREKRLLSAPRLPAQVTVATTVFRRNEHVIAEVLFRAGGTCQGCQKPAPFIRRCDGSPYLEVHHRVQLSNGGEDTVANAIALCPNCHRAAHFA